MLLHLQATQRMWVSFAGPPTTRAHECACIAGIVPTKKRSLRIEHTMLAHGAPEPERSDGLPYSRCHSAETRQQILTAGRRILFRTRRLAHSIAPGAERWWSQTGSNRRPPACKAGALPTELWPRIPGPKLRCTQGAGRMVGLGRLERPTSPLSGVRSNHLSYRPEPRRFYALELNASIPRGENRKFERASPVEGLVREERETKTAASRQIGL
jgi:hypothetical protein